MTEMTQEELENIIQNIIQIRIRPVLQAHGGDIVYKEFKEGIDDDTKNKLEEVLYSSGILNTKIFRDEDLRKIENMNISYFKKSSKKKDNLTKYLKAYPNEVFSNEFITSILESISTSDSDVISINENNYNFDFIKGNIKGDYNSKYIGVLKRCL